MLYLCHDMKEPVEYCTSGKFICEKGGAVHPRRRLDTYVLLLGCEGEYKIMQNGVEYTLTPGTYMLLLSDHEHMGTAPCPPKLSHFWCHFYLRNGCSLLDEDEAEEKIAGIRSSRGCGMVADRGEMRGPTELILPEFGKIRSTEKYRLLFNSLIDSSLSENIFRREICNGIISQILCELSDTFLRSGERERKPSNRALTENVIEYIRINASSIKNVSDVAEHFGYNPEYLTTLVKKNTSHSLIDYINMGKISRAKEMLLSTNLTVSEIAPLCGFSDAKYFGRLFHRLTDTTPIEFRNTYSKIHLNKND
ncbi:MAG: AraC family transcriptional regulator [Eubacteriales bacterium]